MKKLSLQEVLEGIEDTRRERSVWYPLYEVEPFPKKRTEKAEKKWNE